jgi:hypothetical protein
VLLEIVSSSSMTPSIDLASTYRFSLFGQCGPKMLRSFSSVRWLVPGSRVLHPRLNVRLATIVPGLDGHLVGPEFVSGSRSNLCSTSKSKQETIAR